MMTLILKLIGCVLAFLVLPYLCGLSIAGPGGIYGDSPLRRGVFALASGNLFLWALFELLAVPMIWFRMDFRTLIFAWSALTALWLLAALVRRVRAGGRFERNGMRKGDGIHTGRPADPIRAGGSSRLLTLFFVLAALVLIGLQCMKYLTEMHLDEDDSRFLAHALDAYTNNRMIVTNQATGEPNTSGWIADYIKDTFSPWMLCIALLARLVRIHPTILAHTFLPVYLLLISYGVYTLIGRELFPEKTEQAAGFVAVTAGLQLFFSGSTQTQSEFVLLRIWQGKAVLAAVGIPMVWLCFLLLFEASKKNGVPEGKREERAVLLNLLFTNWACCLMSGMGIFLAAVLTGILAVWYLLAYRGWRHLPMLILTCVPSVVYAAMEVLLKKFG